MKFDEFFYTERFIYYRKSVLHLLKREREREIEREIKIEREIEGDREG